MKLKSLTKKAANALRIKRTQPELACDIENFIASIRNCNWRKVRKVLRSPIGREMCRLSDRSNLSPLGAAFGSNAPHDIIKKILNHCPEAILKTDDYGSTALHLGCLNGAHSEVIDLLLMNELGKEALTKVDCSNHSPLHHTVLNVCTVIEEDKRSSRDSSGNQSYSVPSAWFHINDDLYIDSMLTNSVKIIRHFCIAAPEIVALPSIDGETVLDIIQDKRLNVTNDESLDLLDKIYDILVAALVENYKNQKKRWEREGFKKSLTLTKSADGSHMSMTDATTQTLDSGMSPLS